MIFHIEGVLFGVNVPPCMWKSQNGTLPRVPHLQCGQQVLQQSAFYMCIMHHHLGWVLLLLKMQYGHRHHRSIAGCTKTCLIPPLFAQIAQ